MSIVRGVEFCRECKTVYDLFKKTVPVVELCPKHRPVSIATMKIKCNVCGKAVSTLVPATTLIRAWVECPECIEGNILEKKLGKKTKAKAKYDEELDFQRQMRGPRP